MERLILQYNLLKMTSTKNIDKKVFLFELLNARVIGSTNKVRFSRSINVYAYLIFFTNRMIKFSK